LPQREHLGTAKRLADHGFHIVTFAFARRS